MRKREIFSGENLELLLVTVRKDDEKLWSGTSYNYNLTVADGKANIFAETPYGAL